VSDESFERMITPSSGLENGLGYGYGIGVEPLPERLRIGHSGSTPGFSAALEIDLEAGIGVAVLCNLADVEPFAPRRLAEGFRDTIVAAVEGSDAPAPCGSRETP
jgi:CubicO group peptidase (beta-lactamase class C family)